MPSRVVVVGSVNSDYIVSVPVRAGAGETVLASGLVRRAGGKGANQAAACARAGASTMLVAAVGDDAEAGVQIAELVRDGVDVSQIVTVPDTATGIAFITLTPDGENSITVAAGANGVLAAQDATAALDRVGPTVVVVQTEVSAEVIAAVAEWCVAADVRLILNDGPMVPLPPQALASADPLVVNEHEARALCSLLGDESAGEDPAADVLRATAARSVVVTMGERGSRVAEGGRTYAVDPVRAPRVVDTTGAGDAFLGTLAASVASGVSLPDAVRAAAVAASESVSWMGARPSSA